MKFMFLKCVINIIQKCILYFVNDEHWGVITFLVDISSLHI
jgi:hypothetical protein